MAKLTEVKQRKRVSFDGSIPSDHSSDAANHLQVSEQEQWDIINETGILRKLPSVSEQPEEEVMFHSILMTIPLVTLHFGLDVIVHKQFEFEHLMTLSAIAQRYIPLSLTLLLLIYLSHLYRHKFITQFVLMSISIISGCYLIFITTDRQTFGDMKKSPGVAILWIYSVVQLKLSLAILSLGGSFAYYGYKEQWLSTWFQSSFKLG